MQRTVSILALIVGDGRLRLNLQNGIPVKCLQTHVAKAKTERIPSLISGAASMSMVLWVSVPQYSDMLSTKTLVAHRAADKKYASESLACLEVS